MVTSGMLRTVRFMIVLSVIFSLAGISGSLSKNHPIVPSVFGLPAPVCVQTPSVSSECWYPGGPAMDTLQNFIFTDQTAMQVCIQQTPPCVDLTDTPVAPPSIFMDNQNPNLLLTSPVAEHSYLDIQFLLINNYWGINMNFGNDLNGIQIRQGIAHLVDKNSFVSNEPSIAGHGTALDNPVPPSNGGLPAPNPCAWDTAFSQSGTNCVVGGPGGTAYHLASATGVNFPWQPALGSADFCAAAQHFINAGIASGRNATSCVLTGITSGVTSHTVNFFIRSDDLTRLHLGQSLAQEICALFGQGFVEPCSPYLTVTTAGLNIFPGFATCVVSPACPPSLSWWIYTGGFKGIFPFDASLYYIYNSRFVSGSPSVQPPNGPCSLASQPSLNAPNYMYLCSPSYDGISSQMEFAPCLTAPGDPAPGSMNNGPGANCPATTKLSSISAGIQTEDDYGKGAFSIPVYDLTSQFVYVKGWQRVINADGVGIPNYFTWLDAYNPNPVAPGTIRQGFSQTIHSLNPYVASTTHDFYVDRNIYDSLTIANPLNSGQLLQWMTIRQFLMPNSQLTYVPPNGTISSFRFTLRSDLFFQDSRRVTAFDVAFSYLSLLANGAFQGSGLSAVTGITILNTLQFDININNLGPFTLPSVTSSTIIPGHYWSSAGGTPWDNGVTSCSKAMSNCYPAQYSLGPVPSGGGPAPVVCNSAYSCLFPAANLNADPSKTSATFDPLASGILIGSGPWECQSSTGVVGSGCSSSGTQSPPIGGSLTLTRFGKGYPPGSTVSNAYFRSSGNVALWIYSGDNGDFVHDFINLQMVSLCYGLPAQPLGSTSGCGHYQQGIGANGGPIPISLVQISIVARFVAVPWVAGTYLQAFDWFTAPPTGIAPPPPKLFEGGSTLNPAAVAGCSQPYPTGGYDC